MDYKQYKPHKLPPRESFTADPDVVEKLQNIINTNPHKTSHEYWLWVAYPLPQISASTVAALKKMTEDYSHIHVVTTKEMGKLMGSDFIGDDYHVVVEFEKGDVKPEVDGVPDQCQPNDEMGGCGILLLVFLTMVCLLVHVLI